MIKHVAVTTSSASAQILNITIIINIIIINTFLVQYSTSRLFYSRVLVISTCLLKWSNTNAEVYTEPHYENAVQTYIYSVASAQWPLRAEQPKIPTPSVKVHPVYTQTPFVLYTHTSYQV